MSILCAPYQRRANLRIASMIVDDEPVLLAWPTNSVTLQTARCLVAIHDPIAALSVTVAWVPDTEG